MCSAGASLSGDGPSRPALRRPFFYLSMGEGINIQPVIGLCFTAAAVLWSGRD
jgi:hypothetical protein